MESERGDESDYSGSDNEAVEEVTITAAERENYRAQILARLNTRTDLSERQKERLRNVIWIMGDVQINMAIRLSRRN